jgi:NADH-quinone oxidoreductase subunit H
MMGKVILLVFFFMWVRWTLPRFRFDQLMQLAWKGLVPASILLVVWTGLLVYWGKQFTIWAPIGDIVIFVGAMAWVALAKTPLTGRQSNMEPIEAWTPRRGEMKGGMTAR